MPETIDRKQYEAQIEQAWVLHNAIIALVNGASPPVAMTALSYVIATLFWHFCNEHGQDLEDLLTTLRESVIAAFGDDSENGDKATKPTIIRQ